jgi:hypothetical protein
MRDLIIEKTEITPAVSFSAVTGELKISGRAYSNDINRFYDDLHLWIDEYLKNPQPTTTLILQMEYYNSGFFKLLFIMIVKCKKVLQENKKFVIKWLYHEDDDDSVEDASQIASIIDFPVEIIQIK